MDSDFLSQRLKQADTDADPTRPDFDDDDLDHLIGTAVRQGRRRIVVRRTVGAIALCTALAVATGLGINAMSGRAVLGAPAASPIETASASAPTPAASSTPIPTSPTTQTSERATKDPLAATDIRTTLEALLGDRFTLAGFKASEGDDNTNATRLAFSASDANGTAWLTAGIGPSEDKLGYTCKEPQCTITTRDGGVLYSAPAARNPDKTGSDSAFYFIRPDGRFVEIFQRNYLGGNDPVTRAKLPLTDAQAYAFVTDPAWDALAARCQPRGPYC